MNCRAKRVARLIPIGILLCATAAWPAPEVDTVWLTCITEQRALTDQQATVMAAETFVYAFTSGSCTLQSFNLTEKLLTPLTNTQCTPEEIVDRTMIRTTLEKVRIDRRSLMLERHIFAGKTLYLWKGQCEVTKPPREIVSKPRI